MMLRYVASFPGDLTREQLERVQRQLSEVTDAKSYRDVIMAHGGTITDMRRKSDISPAQIRLARARMR